MNCAMPAKGFAINLYSSPTDGNGGLWTFVPTFDVEGDDDSADVDFPVLNGTYRITNTVERFATRSLCDKRGTNLLNHTDETYSNDAWTVTSFEKTGGYTAKVRLKNVATNRYVGNPATNATDKLGHLVGTSSALLTLTYQPEEGDFTISGGDKRYYPIPLAAPSNSGTVGSAENAIRPSGTGWKFIPVTVLKFNCRNQNGDYLASYTYSCPTSELSNPTFPTIDGYTLQSFTIDTDGTTYNLVYTDGSSSGITSVAAPTTSKTIYDLQGRRLSHIVQKGIYIHNGKKVKK